MSDDPILRGLSEIDPVRPGDVAGQCHADWAIAERERILAVEPVARDDGGSPRRSVSRRVGGTLVTASALVGVAALSVAVWVGGEGDAPPAPTGAAPEIGILERPRTTGDALPAWTRGHQNLRAAGVVVSTSRHASEMGRRSLFVARTKSDGVCLIDTLADASPTTSNPGGIACQPREAMTGSFVVTRISGGAGPRGITAIGVVPDGFTRVTSGPTTVPVSANVFVLSRIRPSDPIVTEGPAGRRVETVDRFGSHMPTAAGRRLAVAALSPGVPTGGRSVRIDDQLYSVSPRPNKGDVAIYQRRVEHGDGRRGDGMVSVRWPTAGAPLSLAVSIMTGPERSATATVIGIAPDGYDRVTIGARSAPVRRNLIVIDDIRFTAADGVVEGVATGPAGTIRVPVVAMPPQSRVPLRPSDAP